MILVDSSVWIDFFRDVPTRHVERLKLGIAQGDVIVGDLIMCEVLQGIRRQADFERSVREFHSYDPIAITTPVVAVAAARHYRTLRDKGFTVRRTIDTLIATRCILDDIPLLYSDRDFDPFVKHLGLVPALDPASGVN